MDKYLAVCLDLSGSRIMNVNQRREEIEKMRLTFQAMLKKIQEMERLTGCEILLKNQDVKLCNNFNETINKNFVFLNNPHINCGDSYIIYFYNESITINEFKSLFIESAAIAENKNTYHLSSKTFNCCNLSNNDGAYIGDAVKALLTDKTLRIEDVAVTKSSQQEK